jgi:large repetitive protein
MAGTYAKYSDASGGGGGGGGITSINGSTTPAQTIASGTGISVSSTGGTTTITNTEPGGGTVTLTGPVTGSGTSTIPTAFTVPAAFGGSADPGSVLLVSDGSSLTGTTNQGVYDFTTFPTTATNRASGVESQPNLAAGGTFTQLAAFTALMGSIGSGSTLNYWSNIFGVAATPATNNAFLSDNRAFSGNYAINFASTLPSVLPGTLTIGTTLYGDTAAGNLDTFPAAGNLELSSNTQASANPGYVAVSDGSAVVFGNANAITASIANSIADGSSFLAPLLVSTDVSQNLGSNSNNPGIEIDVYGSYATLIFGAARGTVAAPTYFNSGQRISQILTTAWDGTSSSGQSVASIEAHASENQSGSAFGTTLQFFTTPPGGTSLAQTLTLTGGAVVIGPPGEDGTHSLNTATATPASGVGTITNLPSGASGNPAGYISIIVNTTTVVIPYWTT